MTLTDIWGEVWILLAAVVGIGGGIILLLGKILAELRKLNERKP